MMDARNVADERIVDVNCTDENVTFVMLDGRTISAPTAWFPRLRRASPQHRAIWEISSTGSGVNWPIVGEELSSNGILQGARMRLSVAY